MRLDSLRARLLLSTAVLIAVILPATAIVLTSYYRGAIEQAFDARLKVYLDNLVAVSLSQSDADQSEPDPQGSNQPAGGQPTAAQPKASEPSPGALGVDQAETERPPIELGNPLFDRPFSGWYWQIRPVGAADEGVAGSDSLLDQRLPQLSGDAARSAEDDTTRGYLRGPDNQLLRVIEREIIIGPEDQASADDSTGAAAAPAGEPDRAEPRQPPGKAEDTGGDPDRYIYSVAGLADEVEQQVKEFRNMLLLALGMLGAGLIAAAVLQVGYGLRPLAEMSRRLADIRAGKADRLEGEFPREIAPLQKELNALLRANREIVERARTHVGNLAHALKTPLSVIANETDRARGRGGAEAALADIVGRQTELMSGQVRHHLDRARMAAQRGVIGTATEVEPAMQALARTLEKLHRERALRFEASCTPGLLFRGERHDFEEMLGNLLDNAFKWAQHVVRLGIAPAPGRPGYLAVTVDDDGPGLSADKRQQAVQRGRRLDEARPGSGLGLAIVADLVHLYGGVFELGEAPMGGLRAVLLLPQDDASG
jgi:signal transduction histidine kinase